MKQSAVIIAMAISPAPLLAVEHIVVLEGDIADFTMGSFTFSGSDYRTGNLVFRPFDPFTIVQGDTIRATVRISGGAYSVPASAEQLFGLNFFRTDGADPTITAGPFETTVSGTGMFSYSLGATGLPSDTQGGACGNCLTSIMGQVPGASFVFDGFSLDQAIERLGGSYEINSASFSYQLREDAISAAPEPGTWAMMILGFGAAGVALRRRRGRLLPA